MRPAGAPGWWPTLGSSYLGDGLYAAEGDDGTIYLGAPRDDSEEGWHWVALDPRTLSAFDRWRARVAP